MILEREDSGEIDEPEETRVPRGIQLRLKVFRSNDTFMVHSGRPSSARELSISKKFLDVDAIHFLDHMSVACRSVCHQT